MRALKSRLLASGSPVQERLDACGQGSVERAAERIAGTNYSSVWACRKTQLCSVRPRILVHGALGRGLDRAVSASRRKTLLCPGLEVAPDFVGFSDRFVPAVFFVGYALGRGQRAEVAWGRAGRGMRVTTRAAEIFRRTRQLARDSLPAARGLVLSAMLSAIRVVHVDAAIGAQQAPGRTAATECCLAAHSKPGHNSSAKLEDSDAGIYYDLALVMRRENPDTLAAQQLERS